MFEALDEMEHALAHDVRPTQRCPGDIVCTGSYLQCNKHACDSNNCWSMLVKHRCFVHMQELFTLGPKIGFQDVSLAQNIIKRLRDLSGKPDVSARMHIADATRACNGKDAEI